jgi:serine/threonine protein kinase
MKNSPIVNLHNEYIVFKNQSLGKGSTGQVYVGKSLKDLSSVAVKVIDKKTIDNEVTSYLLTMEKTALMTVDNPFVLKGIKVFDDNLSFYLVTEICSGGTLKENIKDHGLLN